MDGPRVGTVKRPPGVTGFGVIARRRVAERRFAWLGRCRQLAKAQERRIASADAWALPATILRSARQSARNLAREFRFSPLRDTQELVPMPPHLYSKNIPG